jgi:hypothetical protein
MCPPQVSQHQRLENVCNDPPRYDDKPLKTSAFFFFFFFFFVCARVYKGNKYIRLCVAS